MNRDMLIREIKKVVGDKFTLEQIETILDGFKAVVFETLKSGGGIKWTGFLEVATKETKATTRRNPKTQEEFEVEAGTKPVIKLSGAFKAKLK